MHTTVPRGSTTSSQPRVLAPPVAEHTWTFGDVSAETPWLRTVSVATSGRDPHDSPLVATFARTDLPSARECDLARGVLQRTVAVARTAGHPSLLPVLSVQRNGQEPWLLQPRFNALNSPRLPAPQALWMARTMASALEALHTAGWLHTSLTAESAVWGLSGAIVLSDVGWCRRRGTEECLAEHAALVGDIHYTPPELFHGPTHLTPAADMYRLGVALCHWLTGASPWKNTWASELVAIKCTRSVSTYLPTALSYGVRSLLEKLLNRNPLRRPTAGEVMQTLVALEIDTFSQWDTAAAA